MVVMMKIMGADDVIIVESVMILNRRKVEVQISNLSNEVGEGGMTAMMIRQTHLVSEGILNHHVDVMIVIPRVRTKSYQRHVSDTILIVTMMIKIGGVGDAMIVTLMGREERSTLIHVVQDMILMTTMMMMVGTKRVVDAMIVILKEGTKSKQQFHVGDTILTLRGVMVTNEGGTMDVVTSALALAADVMIPTLEVMVTNDEADVVMMVIPKETRGSIKKRLVGDMILAPTMTTMMMTSKTQQRRKCHQVTRQVS
mmetsp:Transcript_35553/g.72728  ORF Transcript_35553/g.72728 Transcript_35553/m.72728 type:complete len:255 (-) Transcript_35553:894-1658(-)